MTTAPSSLSHRVVIAGGGIAGLETLIALRMQAPEHTLLTLVAPEESFAYRALGVVEPFGDGGGRRFSLAGLARDVRARHVRDVVTAVDGASRAVSLASGRRIEYDTLVLAVGAQPYPAFGHGVTFDRAQEADAFDELLADVDARLVRQVAVVVPEHVGWTLPAYELALGVAGYGRRPRGRDIAVTLVTHESQPVGAFGPAAAEAVERVLAGAGVEVHCGREALVMSDGALVAGSQWITADRIVALPRVAGPRLRGVPCDAHGFVPVDPRGRVPGLDGVYAAGDGTAGPIKQGGLAAQQADAVVADVLWRLGVGADPGPPPPAVLRGVLRTPSGPLYLQAEIGRDGEPRRSVASFAPLWPAPGRVASRWLASHLGGGVPAGAA
jgi:sulfide:quinone oxidoreductase